MCALSAAPARAQTRCVADLSRVDNNFCLSQAQAGSTLSYTWNANDRTYDVSTRVCLSTTTTAGDRKDLILALDRSGDDSFEKKNALDQLSLASAIIDKLAGEGAPYTGRKARVGIVMFSSDADCAVYNGGGIAWQPEFPCLFVPAASVGDQAHVERLKEFLRAAEGKFSEQGTPARADLAIAAKLIGKDGLGTDPAAPAGLVLFSDGLSYRGADASSFLRSTDYVSAQAAVVQAYADPAMRRFQTVFALRALETPFFGTIYSGAYGNMCEAAQWGTPDCDRSKIDAANPSTWPVNRMDRQPYAAAVVAATGSDVRSVVTVSKPTDLDASLDAMRQGQAEPAPLDEASFTVAGVTTAAKIDGARITLSGLSVGGVSSVELLLKSRGNEYKIPLNLTTTAVPTDGAELVDKEMACTAEASPVTASTLSLQDLQGGSGSCGVVGAASGSSVFVLVILLPLLAVLGFAGILSEGLAIGLAVAVTALALFAEDASAEEKNGLNALQYRPVVGGVGATTETAQPLEPGRVQAGTFVDYANDPVELGGEHGKRRDSVMDDLVEAHFVGSVGLIDRVALGVHVPYVHTSDVDRDVSGETVDGGKLGRPGDATVSVKARLVRRTGWALALSPLATIPTGDPELLLGDGTANYGAMLLASGDRGALSWAFDIGYLQRSKALELADDRARSVVVRGQGLSYGGVEYRVKPRISVAGNVQLKVSAGEGVDFTRANPAEWIASGRFKPVSALDLQAGVGTGIGKGYGSPDYRVFAGASWIPAAPASAPRVRTAARR